VHSWVGCKYASPLPQLLLSGLALGISLSLSLCLSLCLSLSLSLCLSLCLSLSYLSLPLCVTSPSPSPFLSSRSRIHVWFQDGGIPFDELDELEAELNGGLNVTADGAWTALRQARFAFPGRSVVAHGQLPCWLPHWTCMRKLHFIFCVR
jgi:hypothetical protein